MATRISKIFVISRFSILGIVPIIFDENLFNSSSSVVIGDDEEVHSRRNA